MPTQGCSVLYKSSGLLSTSSGADLYVHQYVSCSEFDLNTDVQVVAVRISLRKIVGILKPIY